MRMGTMKKQTRYKEKLLVPLLQVNGSNLLCSSNHLYNANDLLEDADRKKKIST